MQSRPTVVSRLCVWFFSLYTRERVCMVCTHVGDGAHGMGNLVRGTTRYITCTSGEAHGVGNCAYLGRGMHMVCAHLGRGAHMVCAHLGRGMHMVCAHLGRGAHMVRAHLGRGSTGNIMCTSREVHEVGRCTHFGRCVQMMCAHLGRGGTR